MKWEKSHMLFAERGKGNGQMIQWKPLIVSLAASLGVGGLSALLTSSEMSIYEGLNRPPLSPPGWVFGVVWTILFVLMGIAAYLAWQADTGDQRRRAIWFYAVQLAFNFVWTLIFFNARLYGFALIWLIILWVLILLTTIQFYRLRPAAGWLMLPYLLWVTFAGYLNAGVWLLNR